VTLKAELHLTFDKRQVTSYWPYLTDLLFCDNLSLKSV